MRCIQGKLLHWILSITTRKQKKDRHRKIHVAKLIDFWLMFNKLFKVSVLKNYRGLSYQQQTHKNRLRNHSL